MKVLVTGSQGFVGRHVARVLLTHGHRVEAFDGDVRATIRTGFRADAVIHLAGVLRPSPGGSPKEIFDVNVVGTSNLLRYCARVGARMVFASTSAVYGPDALAPIPESLDIDPRGPYAWSKWLAERLCEEWANETGGSATILRVFNVYGDGQEAPFLVPFIVDCIRATSPVTLRSPESVRDFVHVEDVADAFVIALGQEGGGDSRIFNIGSGTGTSSYDLARLAVEQCGVPATIEPRRDGGGTDSVVADPSLARDRLGWAARVDLAGGLRRLLFGPTGPGGVAL